MKGGFNNSSGKRLDGLLRPDCVGFHSLIKNCLPPAPLGRLPTNSPTRSSRSSTPERLLAGPFVWTGSL